MPGALMPALDELELVGERVKLAPPRVEDAAVAFAMIAGRREILDWIEWAGPREVEELAERARHWCVDAGAAGVDHHLAILDAADGRVLGAIAVRGVDRGGAIDLGYWIGVEHQGRGAASEAVRLALWLAFEALDAPRATACVFAGNEASRRVLEKRGFQLLSAAPEACASAAPSACGPRPVLRFALERERWRALDPFEPAGLRLRFRQRLP